MRKWPCCGFIKCLSFKTPALGTASRSKPVPKAPPLPLSIPAKLQSCTGHLPGQHAHALVTLGARPGTGIWGSAHLSQQLELARLTAPRTQGDGSDCLSNRHLDDRPLTLTEVWLHQPEVKHLRWRSKMLHFALVPWMLGHPHAAQRASSLSHQHTQRWLVQCYPETQKPKLRYSNRQQHLHVSFSNLSFLEQENKICEFASKSCVWNRGAEIHLIQPCQYWRHLLGSPSSWDFP